MGVKCFYLEPTDEVKVYLRRFPGGNIGPGDLYTKCKGQYSYHDAMVYVGSEKARYEKRDYAHGQYTIIINSGELFKEQYPYDHPRWPKICDWCGYRFTEDDEYQYFTELQYRRTDTGELMSTRNAPPGAMWLAWWYADMPRYRENGGALIVVCPSGYQWNIDSRASNCTMPDDDVHRCWIRHGEPPNITVDKNGFTCNAGGGSIQAGDYHGFLRNGVFT